MSIRLALTAITLAALSWLLFFWDLGAVPLYTVGEPREAVEVIEAIDHGSWILPLRNGTELASKPPLFHWLAALVALFTGRIDEWVVRLPSALCAFATIGAVVWFAARRWRADAGLYAGFILATNFAWIRMARLARVDMMLATWTATACLTFERALASSPPPPLMLWGFYVSMGLATLTKGPVGLVVPMLTAVSYLLITGQTHRVRELDVARGLAVAVAIPGIWYLAAIVTGGMSFVHKQILRENLLRAFGTGAARTNEAHHIYYYASEMLAGFMPWSVFLIPLAAYLLGQRRHGDVVRPYLYPLTWLGVVLVFYTLVAGKRSTYVLAAYPAAAIMLGAWWSALADHATALPRILRVILALIVGVLAAASGLVIVVLLLNAVGLDPLEWIRPLLHRKDQMNLPLVRATLAESWPTAAAWAAASGVAAWMLISGARTNRWPRTFAGVVLYVTATAAAINHAYYPRLAARMTYKPFLAEVSRLADGDRLYFFDRLDYGAVFYARRRIPELKGALPSDGAPAFVIFTEWRWNSLSDTRRARGQVLMRSSGTGPEGHDPLLLVRFEPSHG